MANEARSISADDTAPVTPFPALIQTLFNSTVATCFRRPDGASLLHLAVIGPATEDVELAAGCYTASKVILNASWNGTTNAATETAHGFVTGDGPYRLTTSGTLPTGLELATDYWLYVIDANTIQFCLSRGDAVRQTRHSVTPADDPVFIDFTGAGTGDHTVVSIFPTLQAGISAALEATPIQLPLETGALRIDQSFAAPAAISLQASAATVRVQIWWG